MGMRPIVTDLFVDVSEYYGKKVAARRGIEPLFPG